MVKQLALLLKIIVISTTMAIIPIQSFAAQTNSISQTQEIRLGQMLDVTDQVTLSSSGMALGSGPEIVSFIYTIGLAVLNFAASRPPESSCLSSKIFKYASYGGLVGELVMIFFMHGKLKELEESANKTSASEGQVEPLRHQKKEQEAIADVAQKKAMLYTLLAVAYGAAVGMAVIEQLKDSTCGPKPVEAEECASGEGGERGEGADRESDTRTSTAKTDNNLFDVDLEKEAEGFIESSIVSGVGSMFTDGGSGGKASSDSGVPAASAAAQQALQAIQQKDCGSCKSRAQSDFCEECAIKKIYYPGSHQCSLCAQDLNTTSACKHCTETEEADAPCPSECVRWFFKLKKNANAKQPEGKNCSTESCSKVRQSINPSQNLVKLSTPDLFEVNKRMSEIINPMYTPINPLNFGLNGLTGLGKLADLPPEFSKHFKELQKFTKTLPKETIDLIFPEAHAFSIGGVDLGYVVMGLFIGGIAGDIAGGGKAVLVGGAVGAVGGAVVGYQGDKSADTPEAPAAETLSASGEQSKCSLSIGGKLDGMLSDVLGSGWTKIKDYSNFVKKPLGVIVLGGIALVLTGYLAMDNFKKAKQAKERASEIQKIIDKHEATATNVASPGTTYGGNNEKTLPTNIAPVTARKYKTFDSQVGCVDINGNPDRACKCKKLKTQQGKNACLKVPIPQMTRQTNSELNRINPQFNSSLKGLHTSINKTMQGDLTGKNLSMNGNAEKLASHNKKLNEKLISKLNQKMAARGERPIVINKKVAEKFLKGVISKKLATTVKNGPLGRSSGINGGLMASSSSSESSSLQKGPDSRLAKNKLSGKTGRRGKNPGKSKKRGGLFSMGDFMEDDKSSGREISMDSMEMQKTLKMDFGDISKKTGKSIFTIISHRYRYSGVKKVLIHD